MSSINVLHAVFLGEGGELGELMLLYVYIDEFAYWLCGIMSMFSSSGVFMYSENEGYDTRFFNGTKQTGNPAATHTPRGSRRIPFWQRLAGSLSGPRDRTPREMAGCCAKVQSAVHGNRQVVSSFILFISIYIRDI